MAQLRRALADTTIQPGLPPGSKAARGRRETISAAKRTRPDLQFDRRTIVKSVLGAGLMTQVTSEPGGLATPAEAQTARAPANSAFSFETVVEQAQRLADVPFQAQLPPLPDDISKLDFDQWRQIEFKDSRGLLGGRDGKFHLELFHLGHIYRRPVVINTIRDGIPTPVPYQRDEFNYGSVKFSKPMPVNLGFAGFKIRTPLNDPRVFDEFLSFVGSSYFRFLGRGQRYGLSARGLALAGGTHEEEFPFFREFWVETPKGDADSLVIYALLDSSVVTGAYQFTCTPDTNSKIDVNMVLVPRRNGIKVGYAPLTSMFFIGENQHRFHDDYRPQLHDSDGLLIQTGAGEWIWRPLRNPVMARTSAFLDHDVRGFGLLQRDRDFSHYEDIELAYQLRPSYWVVPRTPLGDGHVELFEMPTTDETNDNIVASWVSNVDVEPGKRTKLAYSIVSALDLNSLARNAKSRATFQTEARALGSSEPVNANMRRFMIDFVGGDLGYFASEPNLVQMVASTNTGRVVRSFTQYNPFTGGFRATLDVEVPAGQTADMRAFLKAENQTLSETWIYSWSAPQPNASKTNTAQTTPPPAMSPPAPANAGPAAPASTGPR